jgi:hypothetical protein
VRRIVKSVPSGFDETRVSDLVAELHPDWSPIFELPGRLGISSEHRASARFKSIETLWQARQLVPSQIQLLEATERTNAVGKGDLFIIPVGALAHEIIVGETREGEPSHL